MLDKYEIVAQATGNKDRARWTVLTIYRRPDNAPLGRPGPFVAEIVGETTVKGEERRVRHAPFATLAKTMNWTHFDHKSPLFDELRRKAFEWIDRGYQPKRDDGLVPVQSLGSTVPDAAPPEPSMFDQAIALLRRLVDVANRQDCDGLSAVLDDVAAFLERVDYGTVRAG